jgi:non-specific serine/threonine protein kinase
LATRRTLLLLDNCEHLLQTVARFVHALVTQCRDVTVLATSRERLNVPGEVAWSVPPLSLPSAGAAAEDLHDSDAVAFFCERARAARPTFELESTNDAAVVRICRRLDGIPLALELAAARIQVLSPSQLASRLDDRFRLLTGREGVVVPRQQTLRATLDWSYELLSPVEQHALNCLAVFPDTFDLEAAEAVISNGPGGVALDDALDLLCRLVDKSLVMVHGEGTTPRYRLLETIRQYGVEKLAEAGQEAAARRCHRDTFLARVQAWRGTPLGAEFLWGAFTDADNFRAALEWSWAQHDADAVLHLIGALWVPWLWFGNPDGQIWIQRIASEPEFAAPELADHPAQVDALAFQAVFLFRDEFPARDWHRRDELFDQAAQLARRIGDDRRLAFHSWGHGEYKLLLGKGAEARPLLQAGLSGFERLDLPDGIGWCHDHLGWAALIEGDCDQARSHFEQAVEVARSDPLGEWLEPHALAALGLLVALAGDKQHAIHLAEEAIDVARGLPARPVLAMTLTRAAETSILVGEFPRAAGILVELLGVLTDLGTQRWLAEALETAAVVLETEQDAERASTILGAADHLRDAAQVQIIAEQVQHARNRLAGALGGERFALHETRGHELSSKAAVALALAGLEACRPDTDQP